MRTRKKLSEVALPLEKINAASAHARGVSAQNLCAPPRPPRLNLLRQQIGTGFTAEGAAVRRG